MKKIIILIIIVIISFSCVIKKKNEVIYDLKCIVNNSDNNLFVSFSKIGVSRKHQNIIYKDSSLIIKTFNDYDYFFDLYKEKILIISIRKKGYTGWAGISDIDKDSTYFYDLENDRKSYISLKRTYFVRNKDELKQIYKGRSSFDETEYNYYGIESISIEKNELFLIQPNLNLKKYELTKVD